MSSLEHLIENTLVFMKKTPDASYTDVLDYIISDSNYEQQYVDPVDIYEICVYFKETWCRSCENNDVGWMSCKEKNPNDKEPVFVIFLERTDFDVTLVKPSMAVFQDNEWYLYNAMTKYVKRCIDRQPDYWCSVPEIPTKHNI